MMATNIRSINVGLQRNITDPNCKVESVPLLTILDQMRVSDKLKLVTEAVLAAKTKEEREKIKRRLPAIIISADTTCRKVSDDDTRTGLILMDIDGKDHPDMLMDEMVEIVEGMIAKHPYIIGSVLSVSWKGLKVLCGIKPDIESHLRSFMALEAVFAEHGIIVDRACKDVKRVNFLCHDPNVKETLTDRLERWNGEHVEPLQKVERKQYKINKAYSSSLSNDDEAELCLAHLDPDMDYADWIAIGMALKAHGCSCAVWEAWSRGGTSYKQGECERKWNSFQGSGVGFGSVVNMAKAANGGVNPIYPSKTKNTPPSVTASDFDVIGGEGDEEKESKLWDFLQKREFNEMEPPEAHPPILNLGDAGVIWKGNIHTLVAPSKSGKTHAMASMIRALVTGERALGWNCEKLKGRVVYLDFEQDAEDFYNVLAKHAGVTSYDVSAYRLAGLSALEAQQAVEMILEKIPDVDVIIMDGYADLTNDTNCSEESNGLVARWMSLVSEYDFALLGALHLNPNSDSKSRGHLGSQLERKSKTVLKIDVDAEGVRETYTQFARKQPVFKGKGVFWQWIDDGFVEVEDKATREAAEKLEIERGEFDQFLMTQTVRQWSHNALVDAIQTCLKNGEKVSESTAKRRIKQWLDNSFIFNNKTHYATSSNPF